MIARGSGIRKGKGLDSGRPDQSAPVGQGSKGSCMPRQAGLRELGMKATATT